MPHSIADRAWTSRGHGATFRAHCTGTASGIASSSACTLATSSGLAGSTSVRMPTNTARKVDEDGD